MFPSVKDLFVFGFAKTLESGGILIRMREESKFKFVQRLSRLIGSQIILNPIVEHLLLQRLKLTIGQCIHRQIRNSIRLDANGV